MSDHDELADELEREADRLEHESDRLGEQGESAREGVEQAQADEYVPAPMGDEDPAHREPSAAQREAAEEEANQPLPPSTPGDRVDATLSTGEYEPEMDPEQLGTPPPADDDEDDDAEDDKD